MLGIRAHPRRERARRAGRLYGGGGPGSADDPPPGMILMLRGPSARRLGKLVVTFTPFIRDGRGWPPSGRPEWSWPLRRVFPCVIHIQ
jgi:hypothetical protein